MKSDFLIALTQLASERHLPKEQVLQALEVALASAFKKDNPASGQNISVKLNPNTEEVRVYALKAVVETVEDPEREISLEDARLLKKTANLGDEIAATEPLSYTPSRIAAQTAKQVVLQRLREAERELLYQEFLKHEGDIVSGVVEQMEPGRTVTLDLGRAQAILPQDEQVHTERYRKGQRVKVYVLSVRSAPKGPEIIVSRSHRDLLKRLFEIEVPEVYNGAVEIRAISREAGFRSKVAVNATQPGIDPVGSCIGVRGNRIQSIVNELQGEKIDVVSWDPDPKVFIAKALSPSEVVHVELGSGDQTATVVVPDRQLSLAIGKEGQNTRLAARLTGWRLDIKGLAEWEEIKAERQRQLEEARRLEQERKLEEELRLEAERQRQLEERQAEELEPLVAQLEEAVAEAPAESIAEAEAVGEAVIEEVPLAEPAVAETAPAPADELTEASEELDDDIILETLIQEEEGLAQEATSKEEERTVGLSVEELEAFTLDQVIEVDEEDEEYEGDDETFDMPKTPVLTPDAGKIRFAEDIIENYRGTGRRDRRGGRRSSGGRSGGGSSSKRGGR